MVIVGWILLILGVLFLIVGLVGAAKELWTKPAAAPEALPGWFSTFLEIMKQGKWTAAATLGLILVFVGASLIGVNAL